MLNKNPDKPASEESIANISTGVSVAGSQGVAVKNAKGLGFDNLIDLLQGLSSDNPANKDYEVLLWLSSKLFKIVKGEEFVEDNQSVIEQVGNFFSPDSDLGAKLKDVIENLTSDHPARKEYSTLLNALSLLSGIINRGSDKDALGEDDKSILERVWDFIKGIFD